VRKLTLTSKYLKDHAKTKLAPDEVKKASMNLFKAIVIEERSQNPT